MTRYTPLWLQAGSYPAGNDRRLLNALWPNTATTGLLMTPVPGTMSANIAPGKAAIVVASGAGTALCVSDAVEQVTLAPAPGSGLARWDIVICQVRGNDIDGGANNDFVFTSVTGTPAASGSEVAPAVPANAAFLYSVHIAGGSAAIDPTSVFDGRAGHLAVPAPDVTGPRGYVTDLAGPPSAMTIGPSVSWTSICQANVTLAIGRRYRVNATADGYASGGYPNGADLRLNCIPGSKNGLATAQFGAYPTPNAAQPSFRASGFFFFEPPNGSAPPYTFSIDCGVGAGGSIVFAPWSARLLVEDIGPGTIP